MQYDIIFLSILKSWIFKTGVEIVTIPGPEEVKSYSDKPFD